MCRAQICRQQSTTYFVCSLQLRSRQSVRLSFTNATLDKVYSCAAFYRSSWMTRRCWLYQNGVSKLEFGFSYLQNLIWLCLVVCTKLMLKLCPFWLDQQCKMRVLKDHTYCPVWSSAHWFLYFPPSVESWYRVSCSSNLEWFLWPLVWAGWLSQKFATTRAPANNVVNVLQLCAVDLGYGWMSLHCSGYDWVDSVHWTHVNTYFVLIAQIWDPLPVIRRQTVWEKSPP